MKFFKYKHITFIVLIIFIFFDKLFEGDQEKNNNKRSKKKWMFESINFYFISNISFLFSFILLIIKKKLNKNDIRKKRISFNNFNNRFIIKKRYINTFLDNIIIILVILLCFVISLLIETFKIKEQFYIFNDQMIFGLIVIVIIYKYLFKKDLEKHHYIMIILIFIFNLPLILFYMFDKNDLILQFFNIFYYIYLAIKLTSFEYLIFNQYSNIIFILCIESCFIIIGNIICFIIKLSLFKNLKYQNFSKIIFLNFSNITIELSFLLLINNYSAVHCLLVEFIARGPVYYIYKYIIYPETFALNHTFELIICSLTIFFILIYLELIEINIFGLNINFKKNIIKRAKSEYKNEMDKYISE